MLRILSLVLALAIATSAYAQSTASVSSDGSTLNPGTSGSLVTSAGTWTFGTATTTNGGNSILLNGASAGGGFGALLEVSGGNMYTQALNGRWFEWIGGSWVSQASGPVIGSTPPTTPPTSTPCGGVTVASGSGLSITSGCVLSYTSPVVSSGGGCAWHTTTITAAQAPGNIYTLSAANDNCYTRVWKGNSPLTVDVPLASSIGTSFATSLQTVGAQIILIKPATGTVEGSPLVLSHGDNPMFLQVDDAGAWDIEGGAVGVIANPNQPQ